MSSSTHNIAEDKTAINRLLRELTQVNGKNHEVEKRFSNDGLDLEVSQLRSQIEGENTRHDKDMKEIIDRHEKAMRSEEDQIRVIKDGARQRAIDVSEEHRVTLEKHSSALESKALA